VGRTVSGRPAPSLTTLAATGHAIAKNVGEHIGVASEQRLGRAHFGAHRELALRKAIASVLLELLLRHVGLGTARAKGALVHLAAHAERAGLRKLWSAEGTRVEAVAAADAQILVVKDDARLVLVDAVDRAHRHARRIRAMHASDRYRALAR